MNHQKLIQALNQDLANLHILNIKLHNYHWNVSGLQFFGVHELTEKYYDYCFKLFDDIAERILQLGEKPLATVKDYLVTATIGEEPSSSFKPVDVLTSVVADFEALLASAKAINELAGELEDVPTGNLYGNHIEWLEKALWMLRAALT